MSIVLWPRQEVLQLVIPQLSSVGRHLNANTANNLIRRLTKLQSPEGKISFDRWLVVAKEVLRWNDHCIHLFWDMVSLSTYYLSRDSSLTINREDVSLDLEYVAIFLVLHLHDGTTPSGGSSAAHSKTPSSPTVAYEDVWPTAPTSPTDPDVSSPSSSPNKESDRQHRKMSPMSGTPMSPRSPKANSSPAHKRAMASTMAAGSRTPRSHAQYLHSVRQKIPLILRSLSMDQQDESTLTDLTMSIDTPGNIRNHGSEGGAGVQYSSINPTVDFAIAKKTVDALGLIVCGGYSRDQAVPHLSSLFPVLNGTGDHDSSAMRQSKESFQDSDVLPTIAFSELSAWINVHMSMNDTLYPVSVSPSYGSIPCSPTSRDMPHISAMNATDADAAGKDSPSNASNKAQQPSRTVNTVSSLSRSKPTIINGCSTTVIHVIGSLMTAKSSFRKYRSMSFDRENSGSNSAHDLRAASTSARLEHVLSDSDSDKTSPLGPTRPRNHSDASQEDHGLFDEMSRNNTEDIELWMRNNNNYLSKPETMLPPLYLNVCTRAKLYLISPYHSATITGCSDCEIVIGAVFGAVIVSNCERVKITVACRKLLILNCLDCAFNVATLTTTIIAGDCRSLVVGPYNTSYKNLRNHLKLAALEPLLSTEDPSANPIIPAALSAAAASVEHTHPHSELHRTLSQQVNGKGSASPNCWASLCDVSACLEAATTSSSPSGYAIDAMDDACPLLPPLPSTARLLPYENFRSVSIPFKAESILFEACPIRTPLEYLDSLKQYRESLSHIKAQVASVLLTTPTTTTSSASAGVPPPPATSPAAANTLSPEERKRKQIVAGTAVSKKFMEWLVSTGNAKQVLDLIRIDGEKMGIHNQNNGHS